MAKEKRSSRVITIITKKILGSLTVNEAAKKYKLTKKETQELKETVEGLRALANYYRNL